MPISGSVSVARTACQAKSNPVPSAPRAFGAGKRGSTQKGCVAHALSLRTLANSRRGTALFAKGKGFEKKEDEVQIDAEVIMEEKVGTEEVEAEAEVDTIEETVAEAETVSEPTPETAEEEEQKFMREDLKAALLDSFYGTERGLNASSEARAEINELVTQLEAVNPTSSPNDEADLLSGEWKLAYTVNSELSILLASGNLPLITIGDVYQIIDAERFTVQNKLEVVTPLTSGFVSSTANFEVRSAKRLQIKFVEGKIGTPKLLEEVPLPDNLQLGGQSLDLSPLKGLAYQLQEAVRPATSVLESQPDLQFPITNEKAQSWLLTTYLDEDLRIARGDGGSLFILTKA